MTLVKGLDQAMSVHTTGLVGVSGGFGRLCFGFNRFGFYNELLGIYQRKKTLKGVGISRMAFYRGSNPRTTAQQAWRAVFATGVSTWQALTDEQKHAYHVRVRGKHLEGFNLFMREYLAANRL